MSQYSELMGSFLRTGNYPLEADYIFPTEEALKEFYNDPINATTLHKGLLKVVENGGDGKQALYWVVQKQTNEELEFVKLIENIDIDNIDQQLKDLADKLDQEITDRKEADIAIWGTTDSTNVPDDLNSIMDLANAITELRDNITSLEESDKTINEQIRAIVGTQQTDIIEYLKTLPYQSLTEVANVLNRFLNDVDSSTTKINTLPELQNFLEGYTDSDKLSKLLSDLWNKIEGDIIPSEDFQTLKGIEDFVRTLDQWTKDRTNNLQTEIDQTQVGVGLSGDGSYNPDKETYYLQDATSVMNALKTLDGLMHEAISGITITTENKDVVDLNIRKELEGYVIAAKLLLSNVYGNELVKKEDGLYISVTSEYENGTLTLKVNDKIVAQHILGFSALVESATYEPSSESIVIVFKLLNGEKQTVTIPVGALIREWEPDNSNPDKVVELIRETTVDGADKLSADVRLSQEAHNILEKRGNTLMVEGTSEKITHNDQTLSKVIQNIQESQNTTSEGLQSEIARATEAEQNLQKSIEQEIQRATSTETAITQSVSQHTGDTNNPHQVTKAQIGLSNVDNTSDINKPVSTAQQLAINNAKQEVRDIVDNYTINGHEISTNPVLNKIDIGLDKVDNTADREKPVSDPQREALNEMKSTIESTINEYTVNGHKISENPVLNKADVGLDQVDNTSDLNKPISTATQQELDKKAPIDSPILTGIPQVETSPDPEDASQRIPSTDWVRGRIQESIGETKETLTSHINNMSNPHRVSADQVGAYDKSTIDSKLSQKADLVDGKIPTSQLPESTIQWIEV